MAIKKETIVYTCSECGYTQNRWLGRCPQCSSWNTFTETVLSSQKKTISQQDIKNNIQTKAKPVPLSTINAMEGSRLKTGSEEFDRVLGGGAMKRSVILIGGEPGIGKSTLLIQTTSFIAKSLSTSKQTATQQRIKGETSGKTLYVSGEESASQIKNRADRLKISTEKVDILCTTRLEDILDALNEQNPSFVIIDSIQTIYSAEAGIIPGTVNQLKYCSNELIGWVKERDAVMIMTAHVTKDGDIAGPKSLEHMVDTVISFERTADEVRFLRAAKNRFGSIDELGIFEMTEDGLKEIPDPSSLFITRRTGDIPAGIACTSVFEGTRAFVVEIQALTIPAKSSMTRVYSDRIDSARVSRIAAVLEKRIGIRFSDQDIYINVAGGVKLSESAIDSALAAALYSARTDMAIPQDMVILGELSLAGEIRPVSRLRQRIKSANTMGYSKIVSPKENNDAISDIVDKNTNVITINSIKDMIKTLFAK
ncbi:MAG: DNA repair protein RadA [Treponema sp.]|nr:DNA repair protein RadA [Treponema sp.]